MILKKTVLQDLYIIEARIYPDQRGNFFEAYNKLEYFENGITYNFIQDNQSLSKKGVIRGLHLQLNPFAQAKLIRVLQGEILDVVVDLRKRSETYGQHVSVVLSADNKKQLMVPHGFAHGFSVLSDTASVLYKVDEVYNKESERGIKFDDATLNIDWKVEPDNIIISEKDSMLPSFKEIDWTFE